MHPVNYNYKYDIMVKVDAISSEWVKEERLLITHLNGKATEEDIHYWEVTLQRALDLIEPFSNFKMLVDLYGYEGATTSAHKVMRTVIPSTLANYNFRAGYLGLFEDAAVELIKTKGVSCVAAAHVHQDETKIGLYEERFSSVNERFFTNYQAALTWITALDV